MNLASIWTAYTVARQHQAALTAALQVPHNGGSLFQALDVFAANTDEELDNKTVATLRLAVEQALTALGTVNHAVATLATFADEHQAEVAAVANQIVAAARRLPELAKTVARLAEYAERAPGLSEQIVRIVIAAGVVAAKVRVRLDALGAGK
jgi:methyl-accepting chemotaxis protein